MPTFILDEPLPVLLAPLRAALAGQKCEVADWPVIDSSAYLHDEAALLDTEELADAERALREDGIFDRPDWLAAYYVGDEAVLRAAVKYGWALAHLTTRATAPAVEWTVADGSVATTVVEHAFLCSEIQRRALPVRWLAPCIPGQLEPGIDYAGDVEKFAAWRAALPAASTPPLIFANAAGKFALLPFLQGDALKLTNLAWLEALRVIARCDAALFRELLDAAQRHFVFDKGRAVLSTSEEDIRGLPLVEDGQLEAIFLDDLRGRQLFHVTAASLVQDFYEQIEEIIVRESALVAEGIAARVARHLAVCRL
jgi:hypothetical protein